MKDRYANFYFPLDGNTDDGTFFNPYYNSQGLIGGFSDGFITEFCNEQTIGIADGPVIRNKGLRASWIASGDLLLLGLEEGSHELRLYGADGRLVLEQQVKSRNGRCRVNPSMQPSEAVYLIVVDAQLTARVVPIR